MQIRSMKKWVNGYDAPGCGQRMAQGSGYVWGIGKGKQRGAQESFYQLWVKGGGQRGEQGSGSPVTEKKGSVRGEGWLCSEG